MKIKLQDYSLISNEWIESEIQRLVTKRDTYDSESNEFAFIDGMICSIVKIKAQLIPSEKLIDEVYDELVGCSSHVLSEKFLYDQRKQDFLTSEIEIQ